MDVIVIQQSTEFPYLDNTTGCVKLDGRKQLDRFLLFFTVFSGMRGFKLNV